MGVFDNLRTKIGTQKVKAERALFDESFSNHQTAPSINVPLEADDPFLTTGLMTDDPLKDKRYTKSGLTHIEKPDKDGLIQHMEHLCIVDQERDPGILLPGMSPRLSIKCGPLLRFITTDYAAPQPIWHGSVMVVVIDAESDYSQRPNMILSTGQTLPGEVLHSQFGSSYWKWNLDIPLVEQAQRISYAINSSNPVEFWVPGMHETMNIMFHSCNGFSLSVDQTKFNGPDPLWRDVLRSHKEKPFHVMLGGGDQIYCDLVARRCALMKEWLNMSTLDHKTARPFTADMEHELDAFYSEHYAWWFRNGFFGRANRSIPMVNIFDDHDIIDGFGSYPDHFMKSPVFSGLGNVAFKWYMIMQHQSLPTDPEYTNKAWLYGVNRGPYIREYSRNIIARVGPRTAFFGFDNRTERTKDQIVSPETYDKCFNRLSKELVGCQHLIVLLGVPLAYPRLVWLEELLTSKAMSPLKVLGKTGVLSGFTQKFDEGVELLDDLNDHWTAKHHKQERNDFVHRLQALSLAHSTRVTLLGGDVHLATIGEFRSNASLSIPREKDHRYIPNIISSAIVNTPPAETVSNILSKRNKIHHLDEHCDETNIPLFEYDVNGRKLNNPCLLPRRNWCCIRQLPDLTGAGLEVRINVEIDQSIDDGKTKPYQYHIPALNLVPQVSPHSQRQNVTTAPAMHTYSAMTHNEPYTGVFQTNSVVVHSAYGDAMDQPYGRDYGLDHNH